MVDRNKSVFEILHLIVKHNIGLEYALATHLILMQLPDITWNDQELKAFLMKKNHIID